jgi:glutaredoxin
LEQAPVHPIKRNARDAVVMADPNRRAILYREVTDNHVCPLGLKSRHLLESRGYTVEEHWLTTPEEVRAFKAGHRTETTPQTFIGGQRIGGHADLRRFFGLDDPDRRTNYAPVACVFTTAATIACGVSWALLGTSLTLQTAEWFAAISMMLLAMLKLQDIEAFSTLFLSYDLLARRWVPYAYAYPLLQWFAGAFMTAGILRWVSVPITLGIGAVGTASVVRAVQTQKNCEHRCACVGGTASVPVGFMPLLENGFMIGTALWILARPGIMA